MNQPATTGDEAEPRFQSFAEFWPFYVREHRKPLCRAIHYVAAVAALACVIGAAVLGNLLLLPLAPIVGYGLAWFAHVCVEHNHPATWKYVRWSVIAEYKMLFLGITGRMRRELERVDPGE